MAFDDITVNEIFTIDHCLKDLTICVLTIEIPIRKDILMG